MFFVRVLLERNILENRYIWVFGVFWGFFMEIVIGDLFVVFIFRVKDLMDVYVFE